MEKERDGQLPHEVGTGLRMSEQARLALEIINYTDTNLFLTGRAGTGKTTFLRQLKTCCQKRMIVVAPTGVAAMNAGGVTIHSFFQLPYGMHLPEAMGAPNTAKRFYQFGKEKLRIVQGLDLLVIDEVSMARSDLLDAVSHVLRRYRGNNLPFGGVQLLLIGDLQQLAPVVKDDEWHLLKSRYASPFFFDSYELKQASFWEVELRKVYRQTDQSFVEILNRVRENRLDEETLRQLNQRYVPDFRPPEKEGYILLTTHNSYAQRINAQKLEALGGRSLVFEAEVTGDFPLHDCPTEMNLELKEGAQVMFLKNDSSFMKRYYNGKIGRIGRISSSEIIVVDEEGTEIPVGRETWRNVKYALNPDTKVIEEKTIGTFSQYPLKLAWAITIHKSQGLTFDRAMIDVASAFSHGQVYVALSRCRTLEGLVLSSPLSDRLLVADERIARFTNEAAERVPGKERLAAEQRRYYGRLLMELFDFRILRWWIGQVVGLCSLFFRKLYPDFCQRSVSVKDDFEERVWKVNERFQQQLTRLFQASRDYREDAFMRDRIGKACAYYGGWLEGVSSWISLLPELEIDNAANQKQLNEKVAGLKEVLEVKRAVLRVSENGFSIKAYLSAKAQAMIKMNEERKERKRISKKGSGTRKEAPADILRPELYNRLKEWRKSMAQRKNVKEFQIIYQRVLINLVNHLPRTKSDLLSIEGIGPYTVETYGDALLEILKEYEQ